MSNKPFVLNLMFNDEEGLIRFFNETFFAHGYEVGLYEADSVDIESSQSAHQYVVRNWNEPRMTEPLAQRGGSFDE